MGSWCEWVSECACVRSYRMYNSYQIHCAIRVAVVCRKFIWIRFDELAFSLVHFYIFAGPKVTEWINAGMCEQQFIMRCNRATSFIAFFSFNTNFIRAYASDFTDFPLSLSLSWIYFSLKFDYLFLFDKQKCENHCLLFASKMFDKQRKYVSRILKLWVSQSSFSWTHDIKVRLFFAVVPPPSVSQVTHNGKSR